MPRRKPKILWEDRPVPNTRGEAIDSIVDGVRYFLKKRPYATLMVLGGLLFSFYWMSSSYLEDKRDVRVEERKPLSEARTEIDNGLFVGSLYAATAGDPPYQGDTLWIGGKAWALVDTNILLWKEHNKPYVIVRDKRDPDTVAPAFLYIEDLDEKNIKQQMKKAK